MAEQVRVGLVFVPEKLAWKPKVVLPPPAMTLLYGMFTAVTAVPLVVMVAFQVFTKAWLPDHVHVTFQVFVATVPVFVTVTLATKPVPQALVTE